MRWCEDKTLIMVWLEDVGGWWSENTNSDPLNWWRRF